VVAPRYARAGHPGLLFAEDAAAVERAAPLVEAAGLTPGDPLPDAPPASAGLEIRVVDNPGTLRVYNATLATAFGPPRAWLAIFDDPATLRLPDFVFSPGTLDGAPGATAMRHTSHRVGEVCNVATLPEYRRCGDGTALTWRAAVDGRAEGCLASALQPSTEGFLVYARMGYRCVADY